MHYPCPHRCDIADVYALNRDFIRGLLSADAQDAQGRSIAGLSVADRDALAEVPFLLFSLADAQAWQRAFDEGPDLLDEPTPALWSPLTATTIAFLWHLAKRDPHSARLFSGVTQAFCLQLASEPLIRITQRALASGVQPQRRQRMDAATWGRLIDDTSDSERVSRSRITAMQRVLLSAPVDESPLANAACAIDTRSQAVAE